MEMNYTTAVEMVKVGDNRGFEYLYYSTYNQNKWELTKILGNEYDAEDVLQNAYMKMLEKLNTLNEPEKFPAWFGKLASNMAIDLWRTQHPKKKNAADENDTYRRTVSFSEMESINDEGEAVEYEWEDERIEWKPEEVYTQQETQELVHAMMSNLSDEQRMCLIMFHIQGLSIKEIADSMEVSENTVKSRLNYARKSIKEQGEELKKKGYQLYSVAPLPMLLYMLRMEAGAAAAADTYWAGTLVQSWFGAAGQGIAQTVGQVAGQGVAQTAGQVAGQAAGQGVAQAAGQSVGSSVAQTVGGMAANKAGTTFLGSLAGKIAIGIGAAVLVAGGAMAVAHLTKDKDKDKDTTTTEQVIDVTEDLTETTEITTEEAVDERGLLVTYYQDKLVPEYGLIPEYQEYTQNEVMLEGIICSDIDDYNQDGVLDLLVLRNYGQGKGGNYYSVTQSMELYTVDDGNVVLNGITEYEESYVIITEESQYLYTPEPRIKESLCKIDVDGKPYLMKYGTGGIAYGRIYVYTYDTDKMQCVRHVQPGDGGNINIFIWGYEYENGVQVKERYLEEGMYGTIDIPPEGITAEEFFGEIGIICTIMRDWEPYITFENESTLLYEYTFAKEDTDSVFAMWFSCVNISDESKDENITEEPIDERTLLVQYFQDELTPLYGYFQEYQENINGDAKYGGIICADIDDYDQDGVLDLYVVYNEELGDNEWYQVECKEHHELYTVTGDKVEKKGEFVQDTQYDRINLPNKPASMCKQVDQMWKVKVDDKIYFVEKQSPYYSGSKFVAVYGFDNGKIQILRSAYRDSGELWGTYYKGHIYENGTIIEERKLELPSSETGVSVYVEEFLAEMGIICVVEDSGDNSLNYISFENENELMYEIHNCGKDGNEDASVHGILYFDNFIN